MAIECLVITFILGAISVLIRQSRQNPLGHSDRSAWDTAACKLRVLLCLYCVFGVRTA